MPSAPSTSVLTRRLAAAVVLPGLLTGTLVFAMPASAAPASVTGICNGVVNQQAHRGFVQENLLKAAAKKNADAIAALQADRAALKARESTLMAEILDAKKRQDALAAEELELSAAETKALTELAALEAEQATLDQTVAGAEAALVVLKADRTVAEGKLTPLQAAT